MGLMDFLKKKSDSGIGSETFNFDSMPQTDPMINLPPQQQGFGMDTMQQQSNLSPSMTMSSMNNNAFGQTPMQQMPQQDSHSDRDFQMISLKLDAIKSELDAVSQRLKNLESIAEREQSKTAKKWY